MSSPTEQTGRMGQAGRKDRTSILKRSYHLPLLPTKFGWAFAGLIMLTLIGCINYGLSLGYGFMFLLIGLWFMMGLQAQRVAQGLSVKWTSPSTTEAGTPLKITVVAQGQRQTGRLFLRGSTNQGDAYQWTWALFSSSGATPQSWTVWLPTRKRGLFLFQPSLLAVQDSLGLWQVPLDLSRLTTTEAEILVYPAPEKNPPPLPIRTILDGTNGQRRTAGQEEFAGLRPYRAGDLPQQVSWKHAARTGQLMTREFDAPAGEARQLYWEDAAPAEDLETQLARLSAWALGFRQANIPFGIKFPKQVFDVTDSETQAKRVLGILALWPMPTQLSGQKAPVKLPRLLNITALQVTLLALLFTLLPLIWHQPLWVFALIGGLILHSQLKLRGQASALPAWVLGVFAISFALLINLYYGTLIGRDAGTAFLALLIGLKGAESRNNRDGHLLILLGLFFSITHFFYDQGPLTALHGFISLVLLVMTTAYWVSPTETGITGITGITKIINADRSSPEPTPQTRLLEATKLLVFALPLTIVLFVIFPRPDQPLWQLSVKAKATTGLATEINAGEFAALAQSREVAFRADFNGLIPPPNQRYWRGPVFENYDGESWKQLNFNGSAPTLEPIATAPKWSYTLTLEPTGTPWLLSLDTPTQLPPRTELTSAFQAATRFPLEQQTRLSFVSQASKLGRLESTRRLHYNLYLPLDQSPKATALAAQWRTLPASERVQRGLDYLKYGGFSYTLNPPILPKDNRVDAFLFQYKSGFCEHYAQAFAFLMRSAGLPARIVAGYLGGELNPSGGYFIIRQQDAHAWVEVWIEGEGWVRVDPTAVVAPARINTNTATALAMPQATTFIKGISNPFFLRLDALQSRWNEWIVGYDGEQQRSFMNSVEIGPVSSPMSWGVMLLVLALALAIATAPLILAERKRSNDPVQRILDTLVRCLQLPREPSEPLSFYAQRAIKDRPHLAVVLGEFVDAYNQLRYAPHTDQAKGLQILKTLLRQISRKNSSRKDSKSERNR